MNTSFKTLAVALAMVVAPAAAFAEGTNEGFYLSGNAQGTMIDLEERDAFGNSVEVKNGYGLGLAGGYALGNGVRTELEFTYRSNEIEFSNPFLTLSGDLETYSVMTNAYYDFNNTEEATFVPYVGAGLGAVKFGDGNLYDTTEFGYQLMGGVAANVGTSSQLYGGYRFLSVPEVDAYDVHGVEIGFRQYF